MFWRRKTNEKYCQEILGKENEKNQDAGGFDWPLLSFSRCPMCCLGRRISCCSSIVDDFSARWSSKVKTCTISSIKPKSCAAFSINASPDLPISVPAVVPYPILVNGHWLCSPPYIAEVRTRSTSTHGSPQYTEACVTGGSFFPCSDVLNLRNGKMQPAENVISQDWL